MTNDLPLTAWIAEALAASGGSGTPVTVSQHIWARHRTELETSGDLFFTWQVDLRTTAARLVDSGALVIDDVGTWSLPAGSEVIATPSRPDRWSHDDIAVAVDSYVSMLRDSLAGRPVRRAEITRLARETTGRTGAALDAMMSNISAVVQEMGLDYLPAHPPRSNVPAGVRPAVRSALADGLEV